MGTQSKERCDGVDGDLLEDMALALDSEGGWSATCRGKKEGPSRQENSMNKGTGVRKYWSRGNKKKESCRHGSQADHKSAQMLCQGTWALGCSLGAFTLLPTLQLSHSNPPGLLPPSYSCLSWKWTGNRHNSSYQWVWKGKWVWWLSAYGPACPQSTCAVACSHHSFRGKGPLHKEAHGDPTTPTTR